MNELVTWRPNRSRNGAFALKQGSHRLHNALARQLGTQILSGTYASGVRLPTELDSTVKFDVSRSAYREAVRTLAAKGLVESKPKFGTRVTGRNQWNLLDPDVLDWMLDTKPSERFLTALYELRLITEPSAAALAADRRSESDLRSMELSLKHLASRAATPFNANDAEIAFHSAIVRAAGNEALNSLLPCIEAAISWTRGVDADAVRAEISISYYQRLLHATSSKDCASARLYMELILRDSRDRTLATLAIPPSTGGISDGSGAH